MDLHLEKHILRFEERIEVFELQQLREAADRVKESMLIVISHVTIKTVPG